MANGELIEINYLPERDFCMAVRLFGAL